MDYLYIPWRPHHQKPETGHYFCASDSVVRYCPCVVSRRDIRGVSKCITMSVRMITTNCYSEIKTIKGIGVQNDACRYDVTHSHSVERAYLSLLVCPYKPLPTTHIHPGTQDIIFIQGMKKTVHIPKFETIEKSKCHVPKTVWAAVKANDNRP